MSDVLSGPAGTAGRYRGRDPAGARRRFTLRMRARRLASARRAAGLAVVRCVFLAGLVMLPPVLLIRGGVFSYHAWGIGTWPALVLAATVTALVLGAYVWAGGRMIGAASRLPLIFARAAAVAAIAYVGYALLFVASDNVKSDEVRAEYRAMHPLLRIAASTLILVDPASVITDAGRTPQDYRRMGLSLNEASLHFRQRDGYVHAVDLRTARRPEWRNRVIELAFFAFGFHARRHVGTADHLHVSLRLPD